MPYCDAGTLESYIKNNGLLSEPETRFITRQMVKGLFSLHNSGYMHRDIKAENILLKKKPEKLKPKQPPYEIYECYLSDFGLSKEDPLGTTVLGTPVTMAPEIMNGKGQSYTAMADLWSVGIICYEMLFG